MRNLNPHPLKITKGGAPATRLYGSDLWTTLLLLSWIERGQNIAALLVAIGVATEFVLGFMAGPARHRVDQAKEDEVTQLTNKSAAFEREAAQLRKDADALEAQVAPRRLDLEQQVKIAENCKVFENLFAGKRIKLVSYSLDTESFVLAEQIVGVLRASGMTIDDDAMSITPLMGTFVMGIQVFGTNPELAKKIAGAIGSSGKRVAVSFVGTDPTAGTMRVETVNSRLQHEATVLVGLKPFDANTVNELMRIMSRTEKPAKP